MEPTQHIASNAQDLQTFITITKWMVGIVTPIITSMAIAIWKLWMQNNADRKRHEEEMHQVWETTLNVLVEQGKVVERLTGKIKEHKNANQI